MDELFKNIGLISVVTVLLVAVKCYYDRANLLRAGDDEDEEGEEKPK